MVITIWEIMKWIHVSGCQYNCVVRSLEYGAGREDCKEEGKELEPGIKNRYDVSFLLVKDYFFFFKSRAVISSQNFWDKSNCSNRMLDIMLDIQENVRD